MELRNSTIIKCFLIFLLIQNLYKTHEIKPTKNLHKNKKNITEVKTDILNNNTINNSLENQNDQNELTNNITNNNLDKMCVNKDNIESLEYSDFNIKGISYNQLKAFIEYLNLAKKGIFLYKENLVKSDNPKISVIISVYNREQFINSTLKSVQNQKMKELEIIYVDDCSTDNSVNYIKEAQKLDPRIILLQNEKNMGTLYTKSRGILSAKGKYIYTLDSDDMIGIDDFLTVLYEEAENGNYDFVECGYLHIDLIRKFISRVEFFKFHLWAKLIKRDLYLYIINRIGNDVLNRGIVQEDDTFIIYFLYRGTKYKYVNKYGIFYFIHNNDQAWGTRFKNIYKYCYTYNKMVNALYDVGFNSTYGKFLSYRRLKDNIIYNICIRVRALKKMNIELLTKFKNSPYMRKRQLKLINKALSKLQNVPIKDIDNKNEDTDEKELEEEDEYILERIENINNNTNDTYKASK